MYSKQDLERHLKSGDLVGPLADRASRGTRSAASAASASTATGSSSCTCRQARLSRVPFVDASCVHRPAQSKCWDTCLSSPHKPCAAGLLAPSGTGMGDCPWLWISPKGAKGHALNSCGGADLGGSVPAAQSAHEQCFLCRRARPDRYVYYRDYAELEGARCLLSLAHLAAPVLHAG